MFYLRRITKDKTAINITLGESYNWIQKDVSPEQFRNIFKDFYSDESDDPDRIDSFIISEGGRNIIPIYNTNNYYIMTENGKTFQSLIQYQY